jgi:predicted TIM-barrel fold metal-dependent hydrolase
MRLALALLLIDVHAHIGAFRGFDTELPTLLAALEEGHVDLALISNLDGAELPGTTADLDERAANARTLAAVRAHPGQLRGLAWARPEDGSPQNLAPLFDLPGRPFVGVKLHPEFNRVAADDPRMDGYLALCARAGVPAVIHSGAPGSLSAPERIYALARRHPTVPVVLYHMGFGGAHQAAIEVARLAARRGDARLYLETAQADPAAVLSAVRALGPERVLFGTDATYFGRHHYLRYRALLERLAGALDRRSYELVSHGNAERLFSLAPPR